MSFLKGNLLTKVKLLMKGGIKEKPKWFDAVNKIPPQPLHGRCKKAPKIVYPEDPFVESFYARHPEAKFEHPFSLKSFEPPIARRFARRQLELLPKAREEVISELCKEEKKKSGKDIPRQSVEWGAWQEKKSRRLARSLVEEEFEAQSIAEEEKVAAERRNAIREGKEPPIRKKSALEQVQEDEWRALKRGLDILGASKLEKDGRM